MKLENYSGTSAIFSNFYCFVHIFVSNCPKKYVLWLVLKGFLRTIHDKVWSGPLTSWTWTQTFGVCQVQDWTSDSLSTPMF